MTKPWLVKVGALFVKKEDASFWHTPLKFLFYPHPSLKPSDVLYLWTFRDVRDGVRDHFILHCFLTLVKTTGLWVVNQSLASSKWLSYASQVTGFLFIPHSSETPIKREFPEHLVRDEGKKDKTSVSIKKHFQLVNKIQWYVYKSHAHSWY